MRVSWPVWGVGAVHAVVREDAAGVTATLIVRTEGAERPRTVALVVALVALLVLSLGLLHQPVEVLDVVDRLVQDLDFGHFLHGSSSGDVLS